MALLTANFETGVNGATIATSDAGSSDSWDFVNIGTGATATYDTANSGNPAIHGSLRGKFAVTGTSATSYVGWSTKLGTITEHYGRAFIWAAQNPSGAAQRLISFFSGGNAAVSIAMGTSGVLATRDKNNANINVGTVAVSLNQWVRIEWHIIHSATVGQIEVKFFNNNQTLVPSETLTSTASFDLQASANEIRLGITDATTSKTFHFDDIIVGASSYPGRIAHTANFELGSNGANIAIGGTGSIYPWQTVLITAPGTLTYDNAHSRDTMAMKVVPSTATSGIWAEWNTSSGAFGPLTDHYGRTYLYLSATPSVTNPSFIGMSDSAVAVALSFRLNTSGKLQLIDSTLAVKATSTSTIAIGQWIRLEWHIVHSTTVGSIEVKYFSSPDSTSPDETLTATSLNTKTSGDYMRFGMMFISPSGHGTTYWFDDIVAGVPAYPGPSQTFQLPPFSNVTIGP